jgi:hypothetical protein
LKQISEKILGVQKFVFSETGSVVVAKATEVKCRCGLSRKFLFFWGLKNSFFLMQRSVAGEKAV